MIAVVTHIVAAMVGGAIGVLVMALLIGGDDDCNR